MRGALLARIGGDTHLGIIPADAGSTLELDAWTEYIWDHPRGCGEHLAYAASTASGAGSSPRMRGALR